MRLRNFPIFIILALLSLLSVSCIEDGFSTSPSDQPVFGCDTLDLGLVFTDEPTATVRTVLHNPAGKGLNVQRIAVSGPDASCFRINVDGRSGTEFTNTEIRSRDSIYVFVEATLPEAPDARPTVYSAQIDVTTNGVTRSLPLKATGRNVRRLHAAVFDTDAVLDAQMPYVIFDSLVVAPGARLTIEPGSTLYFHDKAMMVVRGSLHSCGTAAEPVNFTGDRTGNVVGDISFDIMSRQWTGVFFTSTSTDNVLEFTDIRNTVQGVLVNKAPLTLLGCRLHNSGMLVLEAYHAQIMAAACEFTEASDGLVYLQGGTHSFERCTFSNNYLFTAVNGPAISFAHVNDDIWTGFDDGSGMPYCSASFSNSIIYGIGADLSHGDLSGTEIFFRNCLMRSAGSDDDNFINCLWDADPLFYTVREDYLFDYRLQPDSPAINAADTSLDSFLPATDLSGLSWARDLGANVFAPQD